MRRAGGTADLPWMPVFIGDELAETSHMTAEEVGAYHLLKCHYWQHGGLPDDDDRLSRICRLPPSRWQELRSIVASLFGEGWRHDKLEHHRILAAEQREKKSEAGKKGARSRWGDGNGNGSANGATNSTATHSANNEAIGHQHQMKNGAYEGKTSPPARKEPIPLFASKAQATAWLIDQEVFPGDLDPLVKKALDTTLTWADVRKAAA